MAQRKAKGSNDEPEQKKFELPSEREHLFQVTDVYEQSNAPGNMELDGDTVCAKLEVCGGCEEGRTTLNRMTLDDTGKGFWATRLFLKAISEVYKGEAFDINTENWIGKQFYATIVHNGKYANIKEFNFDKIIEQPMGAVKDTTPGADGPALDDAKAWDE